MHCIRLKPYFFGSLLLGLALHASSLPAVEIVEIEKNDFKIGRFEDWRKLNVVVNKTLQLKPKGFMGLGNTWVVTPGIYSNLTRVTISEQQYALIPIEIHSQNGKQNWDGITNCKGEAFAHVAVNLATSQLANRGIWLFPDCPGTNDQWTMFQMIDVKGSGELSIREYKTPEEATLAAQNAADAIREKKIQEAAALASENIRTRNAKKKIGATLCSRGQDNDYVGYTEANSPDSNKIQIRISHAYYKGSTTLRKDFTPNIVWDDPDNWMLCEAAD